MITFIGTQCARNHTNETMRNRLNVKFVRIVLPLLQPVLQIIHSENAFHANSQKCLVLCSRLIKMFTQNEMNFLVSLWLIHRFLAAKQYNVSPCNYLCNCSYTTITPVILLLFKLGIRSGKSLNARRSLCAFLFKGFFTGTHVFTQRVTGSLGKWHDRCLQFLEIQECRTNAREHTYSNRREFYNKSSVASDIASDYRAIEIEKREKKKKDTCKR